jgi:hypothetical protein
MSFDLRIVKGDIAIERDGTLNLVRDNEKLRQDIVKILLTRLGENKFHPAYGSEIGALQIGGFVDAEFVELDLTASAEGAVRKIIALQRGQVRKQFLSPGEIIVDIRSINVSRDLSDPRLYNIFISVLTQRLTTITETITVRII